MQLKEIKLYPIQAGVANSFVRKHHYSGKIVPNSKVHFGAYNGKQLVGVMSFGCPMNKNKTMPLVKDTKWGAMLELNRMAFINDTPKNTESRCLSIALKLIKKAYPFMEWILTYADGCQCGHGTIYQACNFKLVDIKKNTGMLLLKNGQIVSRKSLDHLNHNGKFGSTIYREKGLIDKPLDGFQLKYIYFLNPEAEKRLTVKVLPYTEIDKIGARMYKGVSSLKVKHQANQLEKGGAVPTDTLQTKEAANGR
jgi:hypothetical protein